VQVQVPGTPCSNRLIYGRSCRRHVACCCARDYILGCWQHLLCGVVDEVTFEMHAECSSQVGRGVTEGDNTAALFQGACSYPGLSAPDV
jgi:hypothetical protein